MVMPIDPIPPAPSMKTNHNTPDDFFIALHKEYLTIAPKNKCAAVIANRIYNWIDPEEDPTAFMSFITSPLPQIVHAGKNTLEDGGGFVLTSWSDAKEVEGLHTRFRRQDRWRLR